MIIKGLPSFREEYGHCRSVSRELAAIKAICDGQKIARGRPWKQRIREKTVNFRHGRRVILRPPTVRFVAQAIARGIRVRFTL